MNESRKAAKPNPRAKSPVPNPSLGKGPLRTALPDLVGEILDGESVLRGITCFLCDSEIVERLLADKSRRQFGIKPEICTDLSGVGAGLEALVTVPLFGQPAPLLVKIPAKVTKSSWTSLVTELEKLSPSPEASGTSHPPVWLVGSPSLRRVINPLAWMACHLTYAPRRFEALGVVRQLFERHEALAERTREAASQAMADALSIYDLDFLQIDDHFSRMSSTGLAFADVFTDVPALDIFRLVEALPTESLPQILLRLDQCKRNGEDAGRIHSVTSSFLRQFLRFSLVTQRGLSEDQAFAELGLPFPARAKFSAARKRFSFQSVSTFLERAPSLELELRQSSRGHDILAVEYSRLFT